jgi:hypothetical protein
MAFVEYVLLAFLGSTAAVPASAPGNASVRTFAEEAVAQPVGGEMGASSVANSNSKGASKGHKGGKKGHKGGKKGKKGSGGTTTPPPK